MSFPAAAFNVIRQSACSDYCFYYAASAYVSREAFTLID